MTAVDDDYQAAVARSFAVLKEIVDERELAASTVPIAGDLGRLVPVCRVHEHDSELIQSLACWRIRNMDAYPTQFPVTLPDTARWLRQLVLDVPDRLMFIVTGPDGRPIGHVGIADAFADRRSARIDNVMRGVDDAQPGIMSAAVDALIKWVRRSIAPDTIWLKLFSDNDKGIRFYHRLGFKDDRLMPLRRVVLADRVAYRPTSPEAAERYHLRMVLVASDPTPATKRRLDGVRHP